MYNKTIGALQQILQWHVFICESEHNQTQKFLHLLLLKVILDLNNSELLYKQKKLVRNDLGV